MNLNRRSFLGRVAGGIVGTALVISLPLSLIPSGVKSRAACDYLLKTWKEYTKLHHSWPRTFLVGQELFDQFEGELKPVQRFTSVGLKNPNLKFKGTTVVRSDYPGWWVKVV